LQNRYLKELSTKELPDHYRQLRLVLLVQLERLLAQYCLKKKIESRQMS
jgi:hypothetical protein